MSDFLPLGMPDITKQFLPLKGISTANLQLQPKREHFLNGVPPESDA